MKHCWAFLVLSALACGTVACSDSPTTATVISASPSPDLVIPASLSLDSLSGEAGTAVLQAVVRNKTQAVIPGVTVVFTTAAGTLDPDKATTNDKGIAQSTLKSEPGSVKVTATVGTLSTSTLVAVQPPPPAPAPRQPQPPAPPPPPPPPPAPAPAPSYVVNLMVSPAVPLVGQPVTFTATVSPANSAGPATNYSWSFAAGSAPVPSTVPTITFTYGATGDFLVRMTATGAGSSGTGSLFITVGEAIPTITVSCNTGVRATLQTFCVATATMGGALVPSTDIIDTTWDFGEGFPAVAFAGNVSPPHTYLFAATFTVRASVRVVGATGPGIGTTTTTILP